MGRYSFSRDGQYTLVHNTCLNCGGIFDTYPSQRKLFCSPKCRKEYNAKTKILKTCRWCGKKFYRYIKMIQQVPSLGHYCSDECRRKGRHKDKVAVICRHCGKKFFAPLKRIEDGRGKYCSKQCYVVAARTGETILDIRKCPFCKNEFLVTSRSPNKIFCSRRCAKSRENNPQWIGGYIPEYNEDFNSAKKEQIKDRDGRKCVLCGRSEMITLLHVHHIDYDKTNCDPMNLITLCNSCHSRTNSHREYWTLNLTSIMTERYGNSGTGSL